MNKKHYTLQCWIPVAPVYQAIGFCFLSAKIIIFIRFGNNERKDPGVPSRCPTTNPRQK